MGKGSENHPLTLRDLGFTQEYIGEIQNSAYVPVEPGEVFPGNVTHEIDGETEVIALVARTARARFEGLGIPAQVVEPTTASVQVPTKPSGSA